MSETRALKEAVSAASRLLGRMRPPTHAVLYARDTETCFSFEKVELSTCQVVSCTAKCVRDDITDEHYEEALLELFPRSELGDVLIFRSTQVAGYMTGTPNLGHKSFSH